MWNTAYLLDVVERKSPANTVVVLFLSASRIHHQDVYGVTKHETAPVCVFLIPNLKSVSGAIGNC
ncbi:hypothetical protein [Trichormus sp. NMC-1]|uniref:hypothetical protein n=1 Tax=Trichormus sp. NMC-1 TaxID=1853259 RepID=UPI0008DBF039|nr:hypothetical protein [Trichormus sp. NMC-1]